MGRKTRRLHGGAKLGEGSKGIVYDLQNTADGKNFYQILNMQKNDISGIILHGPSGRKAIHGDDVMNFIKYIDKPHRIAKILKHHGARTRKSIGGKRIKQGVDDEVRSNLKLLKIFGSKGAKFLVIDPHLTFKGHAFIACTITYAAGPPTHVLFGTKCQGLDADVQLHKLLRDILKCIEHMETVKVRHNDIKAENIMMCSDGTYKLIDWGNATFNNDLRSGQFCGPLAKYLMGLGAATAVGVIRKKLALKNPALVKSDLFQRHYERSVAEFKALVASGSAAAYTGSHDLYGLGLTLIQLCVRYKLDCADYDSLIGLLMSYEHAPRAADVLKLLAKN